MELKVTVKKGVQTSFTSEQLKEIAGAMCVKLPDNLRLVSYGQTAPLDTTLAWQPTNGAGSPVGKVKSFTDGEWK